LVCGFRWERGVVRSRVRKERECLRGRLKRG
jgi:hypothetical protein